MTNLCARRGWVTGPTVPIPVDPHAYAWIGEPAPPTPCSHLLCRSCCHDVSARDGWFLDDTGLASGLPVIEWLSALYDDPTWTDQPSARARRGPEFRTYLCRCTFRAVFQATQLDLGENGFGGPQAFAPWECAGHATLSLPTRVRGIVVADDGAWTQQLAQLIDAEGHVDALVAFREALAGTEAVETFDRAMAAWLFGGTPRQRRVGLSVACSRGARLLVDAVEAVVRDGAQGFRGVAVELPLEGGDLEARLWSTYAGFAVAGLIPAERALPELRRAAREGLAPWVFRDLLRLDPAWADANLEGLLAAAASRAPAMVRSIELGDGMPLAWWPRLAAVPGLDRQAVIDAVAPVMFGPTRAAAIAALGEPREKVPDGR